MKISIYKTPWNGTLGIMFWEERGGKIYAAKPVDLVFEETPEGMTDREPTLSFGHMMSGEFMKAMAEELDRQDVKTDKDAKIAGTLEAMRNHLSDLRQMLKLK